MQEEVRMSTPVCRDFVKGQCQRDKCKFAHELPSEKEKPPKGSKAAKRVKNKEKYERKRAKVKNTETFEPMKGPVDMRVVCDTSKDKLSVELTSRDVLLVPNLFSEFEKGELYSRLENEIKTCGVPEEELLKLWHGDSHFIADDHTPWKKNAPTFAMVIDRLRSFFGMDIKATRFNWYKDTAQWKPFHFDASSVKPEKAKVQNFTVAVSFGATRDASFEHDKTRAVISMPQPDGTIYAFAKDTNCLWRHGILKENEVRNEGRISIIAWGWVDNQKDVA